MRTTATRKRRIATLIQRIPATLVKWIYLLLILLTVTINTFSGDLPPIARANPRDTTPVPSGIGCIQFKKHSETCKTDGTRPCIQFNVRTGRCLPGRFSTDTTLGGCLDWNYDTDGYCNEFVIKNATPTCPKNDFDPSGISGTDCGDGINEPTCSNPNYDYDPDFGVCIKYSSANPVGSSPNSHGCPPGQVYNLVSQRCDPNTLGCTPGQVSNSSVCVADTATGPNPVGSSPNSHGCPPGQVYNLVSQRCDPNTLGCMPGQVSNGSVCVADTATGPNPVGSSPNSHNCPPGQVYNLVDQRCDPNTFGCTQGQVSNGSVCVSDIPSGPSATTPSRCPTIGSVQYTPGGGQDLGKCVSSVTNSDGKRDTVDPTCDKDYVYTPSPGNSTNCILNPVADLTDDMGTCTIVPDTTKQPQTTKLSCIKTASLLCTPNYKNILNKEWCTITNGGNYTCLVVSATSYSPTECHYYGTNIDDTAPELGNAKCPPSSGKDQCLIKTCSQDAQIKLCPSSISTNTIEVDIDQQCTQVQDKQDLTCKYGNNYGTNSGINGLTTFKQKNFQVNCTTNGSDMDCTITGPNIEFRKLCKQPQLGTADTPYTCFIGQGTGDPSQTPSNDIRIEQCYPHGQNGTSRPECQIQDPTSNNILGKLDCTDSTTSRSCAIKDDSSGDQAMININCSGTTCQSDIPDCPATGTGLGKESELGCNASLIVDMFAQPGQSNLPYTIKYPLSQAELEFVLEKLGIGSQAWKPQQGQPSNLPQVTKL